MSFSIFSSIWTSVRHGSLPPKIGTWLLKYMIFTKSVNLEAKGAKIREAVVMPDRNRFYLLDPFGNYFEFMEFK